jgi:hypothetical protein
MAEAFAPSSSTEMAMASISSPSTLAETHAKLAEAEQRGKVGAPCKLLPCRPGAGRTILALCAAVQCPRMTAHRTHTHYKHGLAFRITGP